MMILLGYFYLLLVLHNRSVVVLGIYPDTITELTNHYAGMREEWYNNIKYPRENCTQKEIDYFNACSSGYPVDESDDYYDIHVEPKAARPDGGCERRDLRQVPLDEWNRYRQRISTMYDTIIDQRSQYQTFASQHRQAVAPSAHFGEGFLVWHRFYLRSFEQAIRGQPDTGLCLLFADWSLDERLPNPCDSVIFSPDYMDRSSGTLAGFWSKWRGYSPGCEGTVFRQCINNRADYLFSDSDLTYFYSRYARYSDWCYPTYPQYENAHGGPHVMIGGTMNNLNCAVNDPLFWFHHTAIDYYWQNRRNVETNRINNYPTWSNISAAHRATAPCSPFPNVRNMDGLSNDFDSRISYVDARIPCQSDANCSPNGDRAALWCNNGRCCSKVRRGGVCNNFPNNACHKESTCAAATVARCESGRCTCY